MESWETNLAAGIEAGKRWHRTIANSKEVGRLRAMAKRASDSPVFPPGGDQTWSPAERLYFLLHPDQAGDATAARDFWNAHGIGMPGLEWDLLAESVNVYPQAEFVEGFVLGATARE